MEKGYTQIKIQMLTDIDQSDYSKSESGKRYFTFEQCRKLALALGTNMDYNIIKKLKICILSFFYQSNQLFSKQYQIHHDKEAE